MLILYVVECWYALWPRHIHTIQRNKQDTALDVVHFVLTSIRRRSTCVHCVAYQFCVRLPFVECQSCTIYCRSLREQSFFLPLTLTPAALSATSPHFTTQYELFFSWIFIFICVFLRFSFILFSGHFLFGTVGCLMLISLSLPTTDYLRRE